MRHNQEKIDLQPMINIVMDIQSKITCSLSGSLALMLQGIDLRRRPMDIDIFCDREVYDKLESIFHGMWDYGIEYEYGGSDCEFVMKSLQFKLESGFVDVQFFAPEDEQIQKSFSPKEIVYSLKPESPEHNDYIKMLDKQEILKFKMSHAFGDSFSKWKHRDDLIHILVNNIV